MNPLRALQDFGQSVWYDNITRAMTKNGQLQRMIEQDGLRGITSNPTIFEKAIGGSSDYDASIESQLRENPQQDARNLFFTLAIEDIQAAADLMLPVYRTANGHDGLVSLEVSPDLAYDTQATISEARQLWKRVNRPNLMIKVPATQAGLPAIETLISEGINVNVTLLFAVERYREVADAFLAGLEKRAAQHARLEHVASVASFFVSRVDSAVDALLDDNALKGKAAIANAKMAYRAYHEIYGSQRFAGLAAAGARPQRLLWASTGTKSAEYSDILYIEELVGDNTVTTVPPATYEAFKDHGHPRATLDTGIDQAEKLLSDLSRHGINLREITARLEDDGVNSFAKSFTNLLQTITQKTSTVQDKLEAHA